MASDTTEGESKFSVIRSQKTSKLKSFLAVFLWLSSIHLVGVLLLLMLFVLPPRWSLTLFAVLLGLMVIPLFEKSAFAESVARFICKHGPGYFPLTMVMEDKDALDPNQAFLFAVEPHSVIPIGILGLCNHTGFLPIQRLKAIASSAVFLTPFLRHVWSWLGLAPASRQIVVDTLSRNYSCVLIPGGVREMCYMEHDCEVLFLKQRLGFIRIAIELGAPLVPCFVFGQTHAYKWWKPKGMVYNQVCRALRFAPLVFWGMFGSPIPFPRPLYLAIGKPLQLKKNPQPTLEEVMEVQALFITSLQELYERHKVDAGYKGVPLYVY
ncbi:hypothetical protein L7F22_037776 [Adiantum nelumboides]|nr:hypothetical protein [Adiantum nelumboides]